MKSNVAAAVAFVNIDVTLSEELRRNQNILGFRIPAEGYHWRMLEQQQHVADLAAFT